VRVFEPPMRARLSRANARPQLRAAIEGDELGVRYVPILSVEDGTLVAVRAELRWDGPGRTPVAGRELSSALDDTGLIIPAGTFALREVCGQLKRWRTATGGTGPQVVLPVSPRQLAQAGFRDLVARTMSESGTSPGRLCLVVGDRAVANDITDAWTMLRHVRALGVPVALEGFGAGSSSLADLREARVDQLWIHGELVSGLAPGSEDVAIVEHIIALAHQLGIVVVADRVESTTQLTMLRSMGCDRATGPFFGDDLGVEDVEEMLQRPEPHRPRRVEEQRAGFPRLRAFG
jgi:EAL domain-containing protein (putative c-di-GMP-specific phosphodiesterase class I)